MCEDIGILLRINIYALNVKWRQFRDGVSFFNASRLDEAGMDYNFFYLAGIYGSGYMEEGVKNTAEVFNQLHPKAIVSSMLTIYPTSELYQEIQAGNWTEETETEKLYELRTLIGSLDIWHDE